MESELRFDPRFEWVFGEVRELPGDRIAYVAPLLFGRARLCVGDEFSVHDGY